MLCRPKQKSPFLPIGTMRKHGVMLSVHHARVCDAWVFCPPVSRVLSIDLRLLLPRPYRALLLGISTVTALDLDHFSAFLMSLDSAVLLRLRIVDLGEYCKAFIYAAIYYNGLWLSKSGKHPERVVSFMLTAGDKVIHAQVLRALLIPCSAAVIGEES